MKVLLVKTSSLGDVVHALPAVSDLLKKDPNLELDWVVEENFAEIPSWHAAVNQVIPIAWRRWRKNLLSKQTIQEMSQFRHQLASKHYDRVIDAQGLLKSALVSFLAQGSRVGLDKNSAREPLASFIYHDRISVPWGQHAVKRVRQLFSEIFLYTSELATLPLDYGLSRLKDPIDGRFSEKPYYVFLHGTTWQSKEWPVNHWQTLARQITDTGCHVLLPWGNRVEQERAQEIAINNVDVIVLDKCSLGKMVSILSRAKGVIAVDTGLGHLATALNVPTYSLFGATDPNKTGTMGEQAHWLHKPFSCSPCFKRQCDYSGLHTAKPACLSELTPDWVWQQILVRQV